MPIPDIVNQKEQDKLLSNGKIYKRLSAVRAIILTREIAIEQPDGHFVTGRVGDYLIQSITGDKRCWVFPWDYFEDNFHEIDRNEPNKEKSESRTDRDRINVAVR